MKWFKMESAIYENAKVQSLDLPVLKTWLNLLGVYARYEGFPSIKQLAYITRQNLADLNSHIDTLIKDELLDKDSEGNLAPHDWEDYNINELSTERVRKHRAQKQVNQLTETGETDETCFIVSKNEQEMSKVSKQEMSKVSKQEIYSSEQMSKKNEQAFVNGLTEIYSSEQEMSKASKMSKQGSLLISSTEVHENKENEQETPLDDLYETMKHLKRSRVEESREEKRREDKHSHLNPLSLSGEQGNEQTQPDANPASSVSAVSLNGNGNSHGKNKPAILNPEQQTWFDGLWLGYWRKNDKHPALVAFGKQIRTESAFQQLVSAFDRDKAEMLTRPIDKRPCLGPWINKKPWLDDDLASVPEQVRTSPKEAANEAVYQEFLADLRKGKTQ